MMKKLFTPINIVSKRCLSTSRIAFSKPEGEEEDSKSRRWLRDLFVKKMEPVKESHSDLLSHLSSVYEIQFHQVKPECMGDYLSDFGKLTKIITEEKKTGANLVASWTCEIGNQDLAIHIWGFPGGYLTLDKHYQVYRSEKAFMELRARRNKMLQSRENSICLPFSYWPALDNVKREGNHIYELRTYTLKPGAMLEWGNYWARGIRHRADSEKVAGFFSHIGELHTVYHIWAYKDLEDRKHVRDDAWRKPGWDECVLHTVPLIRHMRCEIMKATPMSPMQ